MKKAPLALTTTLAALTVTTVALADEPNQPEGPTSTLSDSPDPAAPAGSQSTPSPSTSSTPCPQTVSTTTITAAEVMPPPLLAPPPARDTITLKQSYRPNRPLLYTGGTMFLSSYAATAAMTATQDVRDGNGDRTMYIPVAGPWMHLANSSESALDTALIAGSGVAQGAGVVLATLSLFVPERVPAATIQAGPVKMLLTATSYGRGSAGLGAVGQF